MTTHAQRIAQVCEALDAEPPAVSQLRIVQHELADARERIAQLQLAASADRDTIRDLQTIAAELRLQVATLKGYLS